MSQRDKKETVDGWLSFVVILNGFRFYSMAGGRNINSPRLDVSFPKQLKLKTKPATMRVDLQWDNLMVMLVLRKS